MITSIYSILGIVLVSVLSAFATFFLKKAAPKLTTDIMKVILIKELWFGIILYVLGTLITVVAYRYGELSVLYPFVALQYIWTAILAKRFLDEKINLFKIIGIGLIIVGVSLIGFGM